MNLSVSSMDQLRVEMRSEKKLPRIVTRETLGMVALC